MASAVVAFLLLEEKIFERVKRNVLRDRSNPLELPESAFIAQYRLNQEAFSMVLEAIKPHLRRQSIPPIIQLAATLRLLATGSYQKAVGNDLHVALGRCTVSLVLTDVLKILEWVICRLWIKLKTLNITLMQ